MKVLVVGSWFSDTYELPYYLAFENFCEADSFKWCEYLNITPGANSILINGGPIASIWNKFQNKFIWGPAIFKINRELLEKVKLTKPDLVFLFRSTHIFAETVKEIKKHARIFMYNNDDPFSDALPKYVYRHYLKSIRYADWVFSYREKNLKDYLNIGLSQTSVLKSNYLKEKHFPIEGIEKKYDVSFIGHFENDGRDLYIKKLIDLGIKVGLWGNNWQASAYYDYFREKLNKDIRPLFGEEYNRTINESHLGLIFLSKINSDGYTRRCFEIPATKTTILCERTSEMQEMFKEDEEAFYFEDIEEFTSKVKSLLKEPEKIERVGIKGYERLLKDGHEVEDRVRQILSKFLEF